MSNDAFFMQVFFKKKKIYQASKVNYVIFDACGIFQLKWGVEIEFYTAMEADYS